MAVTAKLKYLRIPPRKVRLVTDLIRGKSVEGAQAILDFTVKKAAKPLNKLLNQAVANAKNNLHLDPANLYISKITVDGGPQYKRWMPRARGQASEIQKRTSHITIILDFTRKPKKIQKVVKKVKEIEEEKGEKKVIKPERPQRPQPEMEVRKPKIQKGFKKVFRRKAFQ